MKISTAKTDIVYLSRNSDQCLLQVNGGTLKQGEKFKYFWVAFMSDGMQDEELDTRIGKTSASFELFVCNKRDLSKNAKLLILKTVFVLILTYGHEFWVMTEIERLQE